MNSSTRLTLLTAAAALLALPPAASAQRDFSDVRITPHHVAGTVYYLEGQGGHVVVSAGDDGVVMIDDQFAPLTDRIIAAVRTISPDGEIRFLINTHVHPDHTGGNENIGRMGIPIMARDRVRARMMASQPALALPVVTFSDDVALHLNGEDAEVITLPPAHTDGDSYIYFRGSDVIAAGDVFRTVAFPVIDTNNGGTLDGTIEALGLLAGIAGPNTRIEPGHGVLSTREDVVEFRDMVLDVKARVAEMVARGLTYEQVAAARPTAQYEAKWGDPERFLTAVYAELGGGQ